MGEYLQVRN